MRKLADDMKNALHAVPTSTQCPPCVRGAGPAEREESRGDEGESAHRAEMFTKYSRGKAGGSLKF